MCDDGARRRHIVHSQTKAAGNCTAGGKAIQNNLFYVPPAVLLLHFSAAAHSKWPLPKTEETSDAKLEPNTWASIALLWDTGSRRVKHVPHLAPAPSAATVRGVTQSQHLRWWYCLICETYHVKVFVHNGYVQRCLTLIKPCKH